MLCCISFWECNQRKTCSSEFVLDEPLASIVDSFIKVNSGRKVYELYIDKIVPDSTVIILYAGNYQCTSQENARFNQRPAIRIFSENIPIDVYSGIERYVRNQNMVYDTSKMNLKIDPDGEVGCVIFDINGKLRVDKNYSTFTNYPFIPLPIPANLTIADTSKNLER